MATAGETVHAGRRFERQVAEQIGATRMTRLFYGESKHDLEKVLPDDGRMIVECKLRKSLSLERVFDQAEGYASAGDLVVVVMKEKHKRLTDSIVCMRLADVRDMLTIGTELDRDLLQALARELRDDDDDPPYYADAVEAAIRQTLGAARERRLAEDDDLVGEEDDR